MRNAMIALTVAGLIVLSATSAQPDKNADLRQIALPAFKGPFTGPKNPTKIASVEELKRILPDRDLLNETNFAAEYLLLFAWQGSGEDKLSYRLERGNEPAVVFTFVGGATKDLKTHVRLYAIPKNASWRFEKAKKVKF